MGASSRSMPSRHPRHEDPFQRINSWDDGYEYLQGHTSSRPLGGDRSSFFPSAPRDSRAAKPPAYGPEARRRLDRRDDPLARRAYPSPPPESDGRSRRFRAPSPPPYRLARSPSPISRRREPAGGQDRDAHIPPLSRDNRAHRPSLETRSTAPPLRTRSPSPPRRKDRARDRGIRTWDDGSRRTERHRSPSPASGGRYKDPRHRDYSPPSSSRSSVAGERHRHATRHRSPSPPRKAKAEAKSDRPPITRSKTTSVGNRFANLSPRWQQAAAAAFQAGSMAALSARSQPGAWNGEKGARVATAALGAAAMDAFSKKNSSSSSGASKGKSSGRGSNSDMEAFGDAFGGFLADQFSKRRSKNKSQR